MTLKRNVETIHKRYATFSAQHSAVSQHTEFSYIKSLPLETPLETRYKKKVRAAALPRHQEEEKTDKTKQAQIGQMYEKHSLFPQRGNRGKNTGTK